MVSEKVLNQIGFQKEITCKEPNFNFWNDEEYLKYTEREYLNSPTKEVDEVYRMSEFILLQKSTGIRLKVIYSENYYGNELDYKIIEVFVIMNDGKRIQVLDLNVDKKTIVSDEGNIDFKSIWKK
ncbi:hypothetical protein ACRZ9O_10425 [Aquirufa sp. HETE-40SA]